MNNLTTDWNDGTLVAALVDAHAPGLCPEHATMTPDNALENASHSMKLAEDWLGVPQVRTRVHVCTYMYMYVRTFGLVLNKYIVYILCILGVLCSTFG